MRCRVLLFAQLADAAGRREIDVDLPDEAIVSDAIDEIVGLHGSFATLRDRVAVAVNEHYATPTRRLADGDTIALIPPVSGG